MDKFENMKITICGTNTIDTGVGIFFNIQADDACKRFNSYLNFHEILNLDHLAILDLAWDNIYSTKIVGWLQTISICKELTKMTNTVYVPRPKITPIKKSWLHKFAFI